MVMKYSIFFLWGVLTFAIQKWSCILQEESRERAAKSKKFYQLEKGPNVYEYMEVSSFSLYDVVEVTLQDGFSRD